MRRTRFICVLSIAAISVLTTSSEFAYAQDGASKKSDGTFYFRLDNDSLARPTSSDTNYTMGVAIRVATTTEKDKSHIDANPLFRPLDAINSKAWLLPRSGAPEMYADRPYRSFLVGDNAHTPKCLDTAENCAARGLPLTNDRPYDNIFYVGAARKIRYRDETADSTELSVGLHGTNIGNLVQTRIHEICCRDKIPQEWRTQVGDGGSPTFLYKQMRSHYWERWGIDFEGKYGFWLGWNTWPTVGLAGRYGPMRLEYDASYVLFNESLQGAWAGKNTVSYSYSEVERVVTLMHFQFDFVEFYYRTIQRDTRRLDWGLEYGQNWKTRDLKVDGVESMHRWGTLAFWYRFD